jgi:hypothetical protein
MVVRLSSRPVGSITDPRILSSLRKRSAYTASSHEAEHGTDDLADQTPAARIGDRRTMRIGFSLPKRPVGLFQEIALSRRENEGGSASEARTPGTSASEVDDGETL